MLDRVRRSFRLKKDGEKSPLKTTPEPSPSMARKSPQQPRLHPGLVRRKSMSLDSVSPNSVPFHLKLHDSELFLRQRNKLRQEPDFEDVTSEDESISEELKEEMPEAEKKQEPKKKNRATKSWDNLAVMMGFRAAGGSKRRSIRDSGELELVNPFPRQMDRASRGRTMMCLDELMKNVAGLDDENRPPDNNNKPPNFPVNPADSHAALPSIRVTDSESRITNKQAEDVQLREKNRNAPAKPPVRSNTFNFDTSPKRSLQRKKKPDFEVKGPFKLQLGDELCRKIRSNERLKVSASPTKDLQVLSQSRKPENLKSDVEFKQGAVVLQPNKKDVELRDVHNTAYLFQFESAKDAKYFVDHEKARHVFPQAVEQKSTTIKWKLLRLLGKRSSRDLLVSKGILRNEPLFGNTLSDIYKANGGKIPRFVQEVVEMIESPCNIVSVGLYRASGNLAQIQKIRFEVDNGKMEILQEYSKDVDVLTGALKLFFRELKEPVVSFKVCQELLGVMDGSDQAVQMKAVLERLPRPHYDVLMFLLDHLVKVCEHKKDNKMDLYNMSVCWGPCLIGIPETCTDIVMQAVNVSKVMEFLLKHHQGICTDKPQPDQSSNADTVGSSHNINHEVVQKLIEMIKPNVTTEGLYKKTVTNVKKREEILRKIVDHKSNELDQSGGEVHYTCEALKKFIGSFSVPLIPKSLYEHHSKSENELRDHWETLPNKETLMLLLRHLNFVLEFEAENKVSLQDLITAWTPVLKHQTFKCDSDKFGRFLEALLRLCRGHNLPDVVVEGPHQDSKGRMRESRYDNIPDVRDTKGEANLLEEEDEKTETKF